MSIAAIQPYSIIQPLKLTRSINSVNVVRPDERVNRKVDFSEILKTEMKRINPSVSVDKLQRIVFAGSTGNIGCSNYTDRTMQKELNRLASSFQDKTAFYSASGVLGSYEYTTYDMRI